MLSRFLALLIACLCAPAFSHEGGGADDSAQPLDCDHQPDKAVSEVPSALQALAALECAPNGQLIVAREGWIWRYPASYFDRPVIAAYTPLESREQPGPRYYVSLQAERLSGDAARRKHETLLGLLPNYKAQTIPKSVLQLTATNELGHQFQVFFPIVDENKAWGVVCAPECSPEMTFMIYRQE
jgi:hypothetical protein